MGKHIVTPRHWVTYYVHPAIWPHAIFRYATPGQHVSVSAALGTSAFSVIANKHTYIDT